MHTSRFPARWPGRPSHRTTFGTTTALAAAAMIGLSAGPAAASAATPRAPGIPEIAFTSTWASGYAAVVKAGGATAFTHIQAQFKLPKITNTNCAKTPNAVAQFRAGMDGVVAGSNSIEHVGVNATCKAGTFKGYTAWYQMAPGLVHTMFGGAKAGDTMQLSITAAAAVPGPGWNYALSVADLTRPGLKFTVPTSCTTCQNSSAQVTAGPPDPGGPAKPPADFGIVTFTNILVTDSGNVSGGLSNPQWGTDTLVMPNYPAGYTLAGPLTTGGGPPQHSSFPDLWK